MKKTLLLYIFTLLAYNLSAQFKLDVDGNSRILGKLHLAEGENLIIGDGAGANQALMNTVGFPIRNTFIGGNAGFQNTTGQQNVAIGHSALFSNLTGGQNVAIGQNSLSANMTASSNTAVGDQALSSNIGNGNTAVGTQALGSNTTGEYNVAVGLNTLVANESGGSNVAVGTSALGNEIKGHGNAALGDAALTRDTAGSFNVGIGRQAGFNSLTGNNNVFVGNEADMTGTDFDNTIAIGHAAKVTASNTAVIGNTSITAIGGYSNWSNLSDGRFKKEINEDVYGLDFILQLRPVNYKLDVVKLNNFLNPTILNSQSHARQKANQANDAAQLAALRAKSTQIHTGFIAQEVEKAAKESKFQFSGIVKPQEKSGHYSLRYAEFVVPLVKAVQEQHVIIKTMRTENENQKEYLKTLEDKILQQQVELEDLKEKLAILLQTNNSLQDKKVYNLNQKGTIYQNQPNPFQQNTTINYFIPASIKNAKIQITSVNGKVLDLIPLNTFGDGQIVVKTNSIPNGTYYYSLILDGQIIETKSMIVNN